MIHDPDPARPAGAPRSGRVGGALRARERAAAGGATRAARRASRVAGADRAGGRRGAPPSRARPPRRGAAAPARDRDGAAASRAEDRGERREANELLDETQAELQSAVRELRELARGIHPAVLTDQGLDAPCGRLRSGARSRGCPRSRSSACPRTSRRRSTSSSPRRSRTSRSTPTHREARVAIDAGLRRAYVVEIRDDGVGGAEMSTDGSGLSGLRTGSARSTGS